MKITIVHNDNKKQLLVSTKTMEKLLERIAKDDSKQSVTRFRDYASYIDEDYRFYKDMPTWMHIYPAAEFAKDENSNLKMKVCNGILLLKFSNIASPTNRSTPSTKPWSRHRSPSAPRLLPSRLPLPCRTSLRCTTVS